ncbi:unnamed protein product [Moneuplotes crassus]|uniref:Uncharacterized protein n=1 Tax=Euplotes crassus TaxID=5936 RepID=A0AAD1XYU6_EUPCR|nr:unnamed protein product [Moneuplotes crassus]
MTEKTLMNFCIFFENFSQNGLNSLLMECIFCCISSFFQGKRSTFLLCSLSSCHYND